jgi:hypothetical protein
MMVAMWDSLPVSVEDRVAAPRPVPPARLRDAYFAGVGRLTFGLLRGQPWRVRLGPLTLLEFGEPVAEPDGAGWTWPIVGGLLTRGPGGSMAYRWREGELRAHVDGYRPSIPAPLYRALQLRAHHLVTRRILLRMRGGQPPAGIPAGLHRRLVAATIDMALCAAVSARLGRRRRVSAMAGVAAAYHVVCWAAGGRTLGGALAGTRVVATDGSPVDPMQALTRLAAIPLAIWRLKPYHDLLADTEVIED